MNRLEILWSKFKIKVISSVVNLFAFQTNDKIEHTVLIIGSTRSGTTFLMESLNSENGYRVIFEPFNPTYTKEWESYAARYYIDPENVSEQDAAVTHKILQGKINNSWVDQYNRKIKSHQRLIKSVRANLFVDYLESKYPDLRIIYIYRHPYQVVASRINLNFNAADVHSVLGHRTFIEKYYADIDLETLNSYLQISECCHTALWCLENRYLLKSQKQRKIKVLQFEDIVNKTLTLSQSEIVKIDKKRKPSVTSSTQKSYQLSDLEIKNIDSILSLFGMDEFVR